MKSHLISAIKGLWANRWSTLMASLSIGVCFFILIGLFTFLYNLEQFTKKLSTKASIVIYIKNNTSSSEIASIIDELGQKQYFYSLKYISKDEALKEMKKIIEPQLIQTIGHNPLSDTIEAFIKEEYLQRVGTIAEEIRKFPIVEEVYYPTKIISGIKILRMTVLNLGFSIFLFLSVAILFIIYATIKSFYWKKTEEIEILKLLGATPLYIRLPFLIEGGMLGLVGAIFAEVFSLLIYFIINLKNLSEVLPLIKQIELPLEIFYILPIVGLFLGMLSSFIALGKIKYQ